MRRSNNMPVGGAEDGNTPKEVYNWRIYTIAIMACMGACMFGYNLGVIGGVYIYSLYSHCHLGPRMMEVNLHCRYRMYCITRVSSGIQTSRHKHNRI